MTKSETHQQLKTYSKYSIKAQQIIKKKIIKIFKEFWTENPTEEQFADALSGLVIFPEITYHMVKK